MFEHNYNTKTFWFKRFKIKRKRYAFYCKKKLNVTWKKRFFHQYPPLAKRYWRFPSIRKPQKYAYFWQFIFNYKRFPWLTALIQRRSLYKLNFKRYTYWYKYPSQRAKNKFYRFEFQHYTQPKAQVNWWKNMLKKRAIQNRPVVRYYIYSPYLNHISPNRLIKKFKILKKIKRKVPENHQIKNIELNLSKFLTRVNFSLNKTNISLFKEISAVAKHNSKLIVFESLRSFIPGYEQLQLNCFDWKQNCFLHKQLPKFSYRKLLNKNESISVNKNYLNLNWTFFLSLQRKKYVPNYCNRNTARNIIYLNSRFVYRNVLKNERLCRKHWTPIALLKNKIKHDYI